MILDNEIFKLPFFKWEGDDNIVTFYLKDFFLKEDVINNQYELSFMIDYEKNIEIIFYKNETEIGYLEIRDRKEIFNIDYVFSLDNENIFEYIFKNIFNKRVLTMNNVDITESEYIRSIIRNRNISKL